MTHTIYKENANVGYFIEGAKGEYILVLYGHVSGHTYKGLVNLLTLLALTWH